ncbi:hypothetical protein DEO72_LG11g2211 [Vigna unguiculata]|uniref:Uncharacterized protein n=1 Tax=Vigna unguiculata TaxID=3917 RepID=A0A4D6NQG2_VIGUN|nr:hypothetical protein DEO72_LG11g2211 [Vigna unguiculata]
MDGLREKLDTTDERLRADQRCNDIEQKWYGNDNVLYDMMEDASNNNFVELLCTVNTTLQCHPRFAEIPEFRALRQEIEDMLLKLAIRAEQMSEDLTQLMKDKAMEGTLEKLMKTIVEQRDEMIMLRSMNQRMVQLSIDVNEYTIQIIDDLFEEQSCEDNTMEEPSAVEEPTILIDAAEASTTTTDLVNDEAADSTTSSAYFSSQDDITKTIDDLSKRKGCFKRKRG